MASAARAAVSEPEARTGSQRPAVYADAVLARGRDLDEDDNHGGVPEDVVFPLSGLVSPAGVTVPPMRVAGRHVLATAG
ncbi:hypothetical protein [Kitasatospora sp. NPDC059599]|uniref:hypothetical protein n=1 Tax=Kitasatospora sp. NPDC059599 TaxID=3346880 RepID=UPI0036B3AA25